MASDPCPRLTLQLAHNLLLYLFSSWCILVVLGGCSGCSALGLPLEILEAPYGAGIILGGPACKAYAQSGLDHWPSVVPVPRMSWLVPRLH